MAHIRICKTCGKEYEFCPKCNISLPRWMVTWCSDECKDVFEAVTAYNYNKDKEAAQKILSKYHLGDTSKYDAKIKKDLNEILGAKKPETPKFDKSQAFKKSEE